MNPVETPEYRLLKEIRKAKISSNQGIALLLIYSKAPGTTKTSEVAAELECIDTQASTLMGVLENKSLVHQVRVGRRHEYTLTKVGLKLAKTLINEN